jgi:peptide-methionine (S)-S-oxide reductase
MAPGANPALEPDTDAPPAGEGLEVAQFAAGCFWNAELTYQRLPGVARTEVGYCQGHHTACTHVRARLRPRHRARRGGAPALRPRGVPMYTTHLDVFAKINPTTLNKQVRT